MTGDPAPTPANPDDELVCRIIGLGGIGQIVAAYLQPFLCSTGQPARLILVDGDAYERGNESRMHVSRYRDNKAQAQQALLAGRIGEAPVTALAVPEYVTPDTVQRLVPGGPGETVFLCVDNHATRKLVAEHASGLEDIVLVSGGNDGVGPDGAGVMRQGTAGNVQYYCRLDGRELTPPLTKFHPEIADPADRRPDEAGCERLAASVPQIIFTNLMAASCMLATWWLQLGGELSYYEMVFDIRHARAAPLPIDDPDYDSSERSVAASGRTLAQSG